MKKTLITLFTVFVVLIVAVTLVPALINWNQYKSEITTKAKDATGRDIAINGDIKLRILPSPSIIVHDIQIANPEGFATKQDFATVKKVKIEAALKPLLKRKIHITGVSISSPVINLQKKGSLNNWSFSNKSSAPKEVSISENTSNNFEFSFDDVNITDGTLQYSEVGGKPQVINPINATIKGQSINGPFSLSGNIQYNQIPAAFVVETGEFGNNAATQVTASFAVDNRNAVAQFSGQIGGTGNQKQTGKITLNINNLETLFKNLTAGEAPNLPALLKNKIQARTDLTQTETGIKLEDLEIALGKLEMKGVASYGNDQKLGISLATGEVDLREKVQTPPTNEKTGVNQKPYAMIINDIFQSTTNVIGTPIPVGMTAAFELRIKKIITQQGGALDNIALSAVIDDKQAQLSKLSFTLPGDTSFSANAFLPLENQKIDHINAEFSLQSNNLKTAAAGFGMTDIPQGLSSINAKTKIKVTSDLMSLSDTQLSFGKNSLTGLKASYSPNKTPALNIATSGGDLDFNTLQSKKTSKSEARAETESSTSKALGIPADIAAKMQDLNAQLNIKLDQIISGQNLARNITVNSVINGDSLTIQEASIGDLGDLNSLNLKVAGKIGKLSPFDGLDLSIEASSDDLSRTMWAFGNKNAGDIGKANLKATIKGNQENVAIKADGQIDQGNLTIDGMVKNLASTPVLNGKISAKHPETSVILKNFANMRTQNNKMGPFSMDAQLIASTNQFKTEELTINMGNQGTIGGYVNFDKTVEPGIIDVDLNADLLPLGTLTGAKTNRVGGGTESTATPKTWSQQPTNLSMLQNTSGTIKVNVKKLTYDAFVFDNFKLLADVKNSTLDLQTLSANMFEGAFDAKGSLTAGENGQPHQGKFTINIANANVEKVFNAMGSKTFGGGILSLQQSLAFTGANQLNMIKSLNGTGNLIVENGSFNGLDLDSLAEKMDRPNSPTDFMAILQQARAGGTSTFETLEAPLTIKDGVIQSDDLVIKSQKTAIDLGGFVNLPSQNLKLDGEIQFTEQRNLPGLGLTISGPLYAPKKQFKTDNILRFYTQKATQKLGQKALDKLFGTQPKTETQANTLDDPALPTSDNTEQPAQESPQDVEDVLKQQGEQLLRGLLGQ